MELVPAGPIDVTPDPWQRLVAIGGLVAAFGSILSVLFVAIGLYITNEANRQTSEANREQQRLTAQGQITDRFTRAVEQLGQPGTEKVDVRLGAIYALERIMRDSAEDQPAVVDILAAFIRVHAPAPSQARSAPATTRPTERVPSHPPVDIQAALTVLGRRDITRDGSDLDGREADRPVGWTAAPGAAPQRRPDVLDLSNTNLAGADLAGGNLAGADLAGANLAGADVAGGNLAGANLIRANLAGADLAGANLAGVDLWSANLVEAGLESANLNHARLVYADLTDADLTDADLHLATLFDANLHRADLTRADLTRANLETARLIYADLTGADLTDAKLLGTSLACATTDDRTRMPKFGGTAVPRPTPCPEE
ncbi:pentapeptide repeat-containing protein [Micromonospora sp. NPDC020750]|uniref:pentapeptide repeat-containing protein n=1 Tax=unclassified Micromonospora TaxID=2617518 RepID=UPI00378D0D0A